MTKAKPIIFLGEKLDLKYYPILYKWAKRNPETLRRQLVSLAKLPGGSIRSAMQNLESDLEHGQLNITTGVSVAFKAISNPDNNTVQEAPNPSFNQEFLDMGESRNQQ